MTDHAHSRTPHQDTAPVGLYPTPEQARAWGDDHLWMWCAGNPKAAAAGIERSRARVAELEATQHGR